jgi:hypothetical protein
MKTPVHIVLSKLFGFIFFLILLAVANIIIPNVNNGAYTSSILFFNANITILFLITFVGMINELFWNFEFPFNILAPLTGGALAVVVIMFFYQMWIFLNQYINADISVPINILYIVIASLVVVFGYLSILLRRGKTKEGEEKRKVKEKREFKETRRKRLDWEDVEQEFKLFFYNIGKSINRLFESKKKRKR